MKLLITLGHRYYRCKKRVYAKSPLSYNSFLKDYLEVFSEIEVISRVIDSDCVEAQWDLAEGPNVKIRAVENYQGLSGFLKKFPYLLFQCKAGVQECEALILRLPGELGALCWFWAALLGKKYGATLVANGSESIQLLPNKLRYIPVKLLGKLNNLILKYQIKNACAVSYVSTKLAEIFPPSPGVKSYFFSTVQLSPLQLGVPKKGFPPNSKIKFVTIANLIPAKGNEFILKALADFEKISGRDWFWTILGEGEQREFLTELARKLGVLPKVNMPGFVPRKEIDTYLESSDIFLFGSLSEGMPRVLIEAAAKGLPIISTDVGGVGDIVAPEWLVPIRDSKVVTEKIIALLENENKYISASRQNLENSKKFLSDRLLQEKISFFIDLKEKMKG